MPDAGLPSSLASAASVAKSHTATEQWHSFEVRMRYRRAERCRLRAEVAIEAGFFDEAREALEEARRLQPDLPALALSEERLIVAESAPRGAVAAAPRARHRLTAATSMALALGIGTWVMVADQEGITPDSPPQPKTPPAISSVVLFTRTQPETAAAPVDEPPKAPAGEPDGAIPLLEASVSLPDAPRPAPPDGNETLLPVVLQMSAPATSTLPVPEPTTPLPVDPPPAAAAPASSAPDPATEPGPAVEVNPETLVRAALSRYEAAYSSLNAAAARAVWPGVDVDALARAFESLQSQRISLGSCSIVVAADGRSANATCAGTATWTPRVDGGTTTEPRNWLFVLARSGSEWQIVSATTR
jgi:hypothetical protein